MSSMLCLFKKLKEKTPQGFSNGYDAIFDSSDRMFYQWGNGMISTMVLMISLISCSKSLSKRISTEMVL